MRRGTIVLRKLAAVLLSLASLPAAALEQPADAAPAEASEGVLVEEQGASQWLTAVVRDYLPREYENTRDWGQTRRMFDGLHVHRDGLQIKTKRRWKNANHGTWKRYRIEPLDPQEPIQLRVENILRRQDGSVAFDLHAESRLALFGRISEWRWDVQLYSLSASGSARVRLTAHCELAMRLDPRKLPPDLVLLPKVTAADVRVSGFRIDRISQVDGPLAKEIGRGMSLALEEKLDQDRPKLADKLNRQIAKNQDKLRLSLRDAVASRWGQWIDLPDSAQSRSESQ